MCRDNSHLIYCRQTWCINPFDISTTCNTRQREKRHVRFIPSFRSSLNPRLCLKVDQSKKRRPRSLRETETSAAKKCDAKSDNITPKGPGRRNQIVRRQLERPPFIAVSYIFLSVHIFRLPNACRNRPRQPALILIHPLTRIHAQPKPLTKPMLLLVRMVWRNIYILIRMLGHAEVRPCKHGVHDALRRNPAGRCCLLLSVSLRCGCSFGLSLRLSLSLLFLLLLQKPLHLAVLIELVW